MLGQYAILQFQVNAADHLVDEVFFDRAVRNGAFVFPLGEQLESLVQSLVGAKREGEEGLGARRSVRQRGGLNAKIIIRSSGGRLEVPAVRHVAHLLEELVAVVV